MVILIGARRIDPISDGIFHRQLARRQAYRTRRTLYPNLVCILLGWAIGDIAGVASGVERTMQHILCDD